MSSTRTPAPPPPVCVAGMHRSGTSMVTKLLHQCALYLGDPADLAEPGLHNPDGYWENLRFVEINDDLLNQSGGGWDLLPPESRRNARRRAGRTASASASAAAAGTDAPATLRARATTLVARFPADAPWGWKDPRNSLTLPFWKAVCPAVRVVVCVRNPLEVALSLHQRNDFSYAHGLALWAGYNRRLLRATTPSRRLVTHYDAFFTDPGAEVRRLADFAGLRPSEAVVLSAAAGVRPELRHNRFTAADLLDARVSDEVLDLYARLCEEAARPEPMLREYAAARPAGNGRRQSGASVAAAAEASGEVHVDRRALEAELMRRELAALRPELRRRDALAQDLQARLDQAARRVAELEVAVTQGRADLTRAAAELAARDAALRESEVCLRENEAALRQRDATLRDLPLRVEEADRRAARAERRAETAEATAAALAAAADSSRDAAYKLTVRQLRDVVRAVVPADATVLVVSRGDDEMLRLDGRTAWHFPREAGGAYAGHYPADSGEAIGHLESLRATGADYLVLPDTALWWLDHYFDFRRHLETRCRAVARVDGACRVYALDPAAAALSREEPAAPASHHAAPAADARTAGDGAAGGSKEGRYRQLLGRVREAVGRVAPAGSTVLVVSKGDERLAQLGGRRAWHFPRDERGVYAGYHPADSTAAINHLEALRSKGAQFLLLPSTAFWWLEHYGAFRRHLDARYARVWSDADCVVYRLAAGGAATARAESDAGSDAGSDARVFTPPPLEEAPPPPADRPAVDVVVCVHDALDDVKRCLESVVRHTRMPYALVLVDDGSGDETRRYLESFARAQGATLVRSDAAGGYTAAANRGLRQSRAPYVLLLNSDTVVGPEWLDRMVACAESDPAIGLVGPLSNTASWQSVPSVLQGGDWSRNALPPGVTPAGMARRVAADSGRVYPRVPFLNGFCLMVRREVLRDLGEFDEATFAGGYGEENDYCLGAGKAGWELAVADDVYVFHRQSASYSDERRRKLCERADAALEAKHGRPLIDAGVAACRFGRVLEGVRARSAVAEERRRLLEEGRARWEGRRVLFVLPVAEANGGGNVVLQEAAAMQRMGVDVRVLNLEGNRAGFEQGYPDNALPVLYARNEGDVARLARGYDAIVATWSGSVDWLGGGDGEARHAASGHGTGNGHRNGNGNGNGDRNGHRPSVRPPGGPVRGYYVQDFEPEFYTRGSDAFRSAFASYTRYGDLVRFTKTDWNRDAVRRQTGADCAVVGPSVDVDLHRPRRRRDGDWPARPVRVAAMVRPATPRRAPRLTMAVLAELKRKWGAGVEIIVFGCAPDDPGLAALPQDFSFRRAGTLTRRQTASLLNEVDVFADFSAFQAMGLTALEAMACGAAVVVPKEGGAGSFARDGENALVVDTASQDACLAAADRLVGEADLRARLQRQAIRDACHHHPERAAFRILEALLPAGAVSTGSALTPEAPADA